MKIKLVKKLNLSYLFGQVFVIVKKFLPPYKGTFLKTYHLMELIWSDIAAIAKKTGTIASGDTDCAQANTAMFIGGGLLNKNLAHTLAVLARAISAPRSLVAYECGAVGPGKDCGYENVVVKAITGMPMTQEGKTSTCAHSDVMGNLIMQCCDCWSNESVEYHGEFGGTTVQCWSETLAYDCALMK